MSNEQGLVATNLRGAHDRPFYLPWVRIHGFALEMLMLTVTYVRIADFDTSKEFLFEI